MRFRSAFAFVLLPFVACANGEAVTDATDPSGGDEDARAPTLDAGSDLGASAPDAAAEADTAPACAAGKTSCGAACVDTQVDTKNCGGCGHACAATEQCLKGSCGVPCDAGLAACGGACVDTATSVANCGKCGNACPGGAAATCSAGACSATLNVRAYIDGTSDLVLTGGAAHWHHIAAAAPGLWNGSNEATYLNTAPWTPAWPNGGDNRDCNCDSQPSPAVPPLAARDQTVTLQPVAARAGLAISQQPSAANGYALRVEINDSPNGADWYELVLTYATQ